MTVEELIEELKKFPPDMEVKIWDNEEYSYIDIRSLEIIHDYLRNEHFVAL